MAQEIVNKNCNKTYVDRIDRRNELNRTEMNVVRSSMMYISFFNLLKLCSTIITGKLFFTNLQTLLFTT